MSHWHSDKRSFRWYSKEKPVYRVVTDSVPSVHRRPTDQASPPTVGGKMPRRAQVQAPHKPECAKLDLGSTTGAFFLLENGIRRYEH